MEIRETKIIVINHLSFIAMEFYLKQVQQEIDPSSIRLQAKQKLEVEVKFKKYI